MRQSVTIDNRFPQKLPLEKLIGKRILGIRAIRVTVLVLCQYHENLWLIFYFCVEVESNQIGYMVCQIGILDHCH